MMKQTCKNCKKNYVVLTKECLCVFCYQNEKGKWPLEFRGAAQKKKLKL